MAGGADASLAGVGQAGFAQENVQYAAYGQAAGQAGLDQSNAYAYQQQAAYSSASTMEGQQYSGNFHPKKKH